MALLFDYSSRSANALFIAHSGAPDFEAARSRFDALHTLYASGGTAVTARMLTGFRGDAPQQTGRKATENKLLSAVAGIPVFANHDGMLFASTTAAQREGSIAEFAAGGDGAESHEIAQESHALFTAAKALVKTAGFGTVVAEGWPAFGVALRLKRELGVKAVFAVHGSSTTDVAKALELAAVERADGLLFSQMSSLQTVLLRQGGGGKNAPAISSRAAALERMTRALSLSRERSALERVLSTKGASVEEKRHAIALAKQADYGLELLQASRGMFHIRTPGIALLPAGLTHHILPSFGLADLAFARKKMKSLIAAGGSRLAGKRMVYVHARGAADGVKMLEALAALPGDVAMAMHTDSAWEFAQHATRIGVEARVARIERGGELEMLACEAIALPDPTPQVLSSALRACRMAEMAGAEVPALLLGENSVHSLAENALLAGAPSGRQCAYLIASAMEDAALREKLQLSALAVAGREWTGRMQAQELAAFIAGI